MASKVIKGDAEETVEEGYSDMLPLPCASSEYLGFVEHASYGGRMRVKLMVERVNGFWSGVWEFGGISGPRERVQIQLLRDNHLKIKNVTGREQTLLVGECDGNGMLSGEVVHDDTGGGSFILWPTERGRFRRLLQEWYVAFRCGPCVEALPHMSRADLPGECSICLEPFAPGDFFVRTWCSERGHVFHRSCLHSWLSSCDSCPLCRRSLSPPPLGLESIVMVDDVYDMSAFLNYQMWRSY